MSPRAGSKLPGWSAERRAKMEAHNGGLADKMALNIEYDTNGGCWLWSGYLGSHGRPSVSVNGKQQLAYRAVYEALVGPIQSGLLCCHRCDVPTCVNPSHIFLGTHLDNMRDAQSKGRLQHQTEHPSLHVGRNIGEANARSQLTAQQVQEIRAARGILNQAQLAARYRIAKTTVSNIWTRRSWAHLAEPSQ